MPAAWRSESMPFEVAISWDFRETTFEIRFSPRTVPTDFLLAKGAGSLLHDRCKAPTATQWEGRRGRC
jgi:hypothetical protein